MTYREKLQQEHPEKIGDKYLGGAKGCPQKYGYETRSRCRVDGVLDKTGVNMCRICWDREMEEQP